MKHCLVTAALAAALGFGAAAQAKEFKVGLITPPPHMWTLEAQALGETLKKASNGVHSTAVFPSGQLGSEAQMLQQMQTGALDIAFMTMAEISNRVPNMGAFFAPYLVKDVAGAAKLLRSEPAQKLLEELPGKVGVIGMGYAMAGMRQLEGREPIRSAADLRGKKVRITPFEPTRDFHNLLGVAPTPMPLPAVYDALANGQVDAIEMDVENMVNQKYYSVAPYILLSRHMMFPMVAVISARTWAALPDADKALLKLHMQAHLDKLLDTMVAKESEWTEALKKTNANVTEAGPEFFGDAIPKWEEIWSKKAPALQALRAEAAKIR